MPLTEFDPMASIFPNVRHLSTTQGHADFPSRWIQTDHIQSLAGFLILTTLNLDSLTFLKQQELHQLQNLKCLSALSLPNAELEREQINSLVNSKQLTKLHVGRSCLQRFPSACMGSLQWLQGSSAPCTLRILCWMCISSLKAVVRCGTAMRSCLPYHHSRYT